MNDEQLKDLLENAPASGVQIFVFSRRNRHIPGELVIKNKEGIFLREDESIWSIPVLTLARREYPANQKNGNTPCGVFKINSVMPKADHYTLFGQYRRLKVDFIPASKEEKSILSLLPTSSHQLEWWKESIAARDAGRDLLRIHGSGLKNLNPAVSYYPFVRTSGCIATREGTYGHQTFRDQRLLLDKLMEAQGLDVCYDNEVKISATMYVFESEKSSNDILY